MAFQSMSFLFQSLSTIFPNSRSAIPTSFSLHSASTCSPSSRTVSPFGIITIPFGPSSCSLSVNFHTLDTTRWKDVPFMISFMVLPKIAGLLMTNSVMKVGLSCRSFSSFVPLWNIALSMITQRITLSTPNGYPTAQAIAISFETSVAEGEWSRSACCAAPSIGVLVTAPEKRPIDTGSDRSVHHQTPSVMRIPSPSTPNASRFSLMPPFFSDGKKLGPTCTPSA